MTAFIATCLCLPAVDPPALALAPPFDRRNTDPAVRRLYDPAVRADKDRLAETLDAIWKRLPEPGKPMLRHHQADLARQLVRFINLNSPKVDPREGLVGRSTGQPVRSMLLHIGLPAVPALLEQLYLHTDDTPESREHRWRAVYTLVEIFDEGGDGRRMTIERIKLFAETWPPDTKKQILSALDHPSLQPPMPPVEPTKK